LPLRIKGYRNMTKEDKAAIDLKTRLYSSAASIGAQMRTEAAQEKAAQEKANATLATAKDGAQEASRLIQGFNTPMFRGLADLGPLWAAAFNDPDSPTAQETARGMAESFMASFTGATDKTKAGGTVSGYVATIRCGSAAPTIRQRLANQLETWQAKLDASKDDNTEEGKAARETAKRYTVIPGDSLRADGSWPTMKNGAGEEVPKMPKFNGRAECVVNGIALPHRGGTDRKAMLAALANLYLEHGDRALHPDVLNAILDNGGRFVMPVDESVRGFAGSALAAMEKLMLNGGSNSPDAALIQVTLDMLVRVSKEGFAERVVADTIATDDAPTNSQDSSESPDAPTVVPPPAPADAEQGEPVALGAVTTGSRKARKARKAGGAL
jgi:hypothetical protein